MELHHKKHHQAYATNFNAALAKLAEAEVKEREREPFRVWCPPSLPPKSCMR